ncbi:NEP1-interacting protein 1-like [Phalaenopsis equestris]|uniref:NEP1-interacting protein 1-like n=1 Tax=Phalaenopsis equestris TaxID=78828 RepID=UPI0009E5DFAA|nr:NEP1-interacting protein 1-like [Phalaenopsis equestris]
MDFLTSSPFPRPPLSSTPTDEGRRDDESSSGSKMVERLIVALITCVFALVGAPIGAVTGAMIGLATETGLLRGAAIGAISGAVFSIETVESSVALWHSHESGICSIFYVADIICSLLSGRLVREKVGPAVQSAVQSQMSALELPYADVLDIFEIGDIRGLSKDSVDLLPKLKITSENNLDRSGQRISCSVCLQDIKVGETARRLPYCQHMFHLSCIDSWLVRNGSCPLCRRDL